MKLTSSQFSQIQRQIGLEKIHHLDIKSELADHIACKIESELSHEDEFEKLLQKAMTEINPKKFQQSLLLQAHLNAVKEFFGNIGDLRLLVKSIVMTFIIGSFINLFSKNTPEFAETVLKTAFLIACYSGFILVLWGNKYFGNSRLLTAANILFLIASLSQFFLRLEWLTWTELNNQQLLFSMTACFSFILCSGYTNIYRQFKKLKTA
ncbi:hypothetical protein [Algoriphagus sp.]|uniref:hypothetical protein n=1 Tax=Algoriphagus sp. TaxID=1872435 RepID=UPI003918FF25